MYAYTLVSAVAQPVVEATNVNTAAEEMENEAVAVPAPLLYAMTPLLPAAVFQLPDWQSSQSKMAQGAALNVKR